jgi:hypothetical protein
VKYILEPFLTELIEEEKSYMYFYQDSALAHTTEDSMQSV